MNAKKIVPLTNVGLLANAIDRAMRRPVGLPGLVVAYGKTGYGKSFAAAFAATKHRAYYVECRETWTRKAFLQAVLRDMGITPASTLSEMVDQIAEQLSRSNRPLLIDDAQYLLDKAAANVITDIFNASQGTIVLIGEERVPTSLAKLERLHNRVLEWVPVQPATADDLRDLVDATYPHLTIADELLEDLRSKTKGCLRRVAVNLYRVHTEAQAIGTDKIDLATWGNREWFTGEAPARRA
ncbi:AAA family ATPase [Pseudomonas nitroreducens]|uniref:AAA family ATPase n=1 Tax=Pseudomonas nitroreducens TaxID=46680 RepID=A0A6G6IT80_PSENT|nr:ATP-binding protein [Pseudomonas nitroreducens]MBG6291054.1 AAA family ATPase [Pseudomonas nitroreducens]QIE86177.1 AAA family ATPase [Pseudomonas nitroreducens]